MEQIVLHGIGGELYQLAAIVIWIDFDVRRQNALVQFLGLRFHSFQNILRLLSAKHQDDAFHGIVILLKAEFAQPRRVADDDVANIPTRIGAPLLLPTTTSPISSVLRTSPMPRT